MSPTRYFCQNSAGMSTSHSIRDLDRWRCCATHRLICLRRHTASAYASEGSMMLSRLTWGSAQPSVSPNLAADTCQAHATVSRLCKVSWPTWVCLVRQACTGWEEQMDAGSSASSITLVYSAPVDRPYSCECMGLWPPADAEPGTPASEERGDHAQRAGKPGDQAPRPQAENGAGDDLEQRRWYNQNCRQTTRRFTVIA